jgi:hypothetical protein
MAQIPALPMGLGELGSDGNSLANYEDLLQEMAINAGAAFEYLPASFPYNVAWSAWMTRSHL